MSEFPFNEVVGRLWPLCRSITGNALRQSLTILGELVPLEIKEYATGQECYDWIIPEEWNVKKAWVKNLEGKKLIDFENNNLHLVNYSIPFEGRTSKEELFCHLHTDPNRPNAIPYKTSYYNREWGFCMPHEWINHFVDDEYDVLIDTTLENGSMSIGEGLISGESKEEIIFTTYLCHPSMANNELSGPVVQTALYQKMLSKKTLRYSYRFLYAPETIGDIVFISQNESHLRKNMIGGTVLNMMGNNDDLVLEESPHPNGIFDRAARNVLRYRFNGQSKIKPKTPHGRAAQRQFCSPGLKLPLSAISRAFGGSFDEYHTSLDTPDSLSFSHLLESVKILEQIIGVIELNNTFICTKPFGEPFMSKYDLGTKLGGNKIKSQDLLMKCLLHMGDGECDLLEIAETIGICALELEDPLTKLLKCGLLIPKESFR